MKKLLGFWRRHPASARLGAFAEGQAPALDAAAIEQHAAGCERCRERIAGLRAVRSMLAALPDEAPSRSFRLTPAMAAAPQRARPQAAPSPPARLMPALAAMALVAFAVLVGVDLLARPAGGHDALTAASNTQGFAAARVPSPDQARAGADKSLSATAPAANGAGAPVSNATPGAGQAYSSQTGTSGPAPASVPVTAQPNARATGVPAGGTPAAGGVLDGGAPSATAVPAQRTAPQPANSQTAATRSQGGGSSTIWLRIGEAIAAAVALGAGFVAWRGFARQREGQT